MGNQLRRTEMAELSEEESERLLQQLSKKMADDMMAVLLGSGAFTKPQPTALRLTSWGTFEVVELRDDGSIIETPKPCPRCGPFLLCPEHMAMVT
jgi:hypothetical protein